MAKHKKNRKYIVRSHPPGWLILVIAVFAVMLLVGLVNLIGYGIAKLSSRQTSNELQAIYHGAPTDEPIVVTPEPTPTVSLSPEPTITALPTVTPAPTQSPIPSLEKTSYPNNADLQISNRLKALQRESKYIVGYLTIDYMLEEAVMQRNDVFYLDHDVLGKRNVNGALFLDSSISLKTRPYTYIIYGHNMKSGAMFGKLRNYENSAFYHNDPFITFDTMYEMGRYVIFAVGTVSTEERDKNYLDFYAIRSANIQERQKAIDALLAASVHTSVIDVKLDDQLLLLVTCVDKDQERRVVAARRIRDDEEESTLKKFVQNSRKR